MNLDAFFNAKSVAVVGASREKGKVGYTILESLKNFSGRVSAVNPNASSILGRRCFARISDIKENVDLAIIAVPAPFVCSVLDDCAVKGVRHVVIVSSGFKEVGNVSAERDLVSKLKQHNISAIGPNCLGVLNAANSLDSLFLPTSRLARPKLGRVSFIVQSGAVGSAILDMAADKNLGIAKFVSYGNASGVDESDLLDYFSKDKSTGAIVMYVEGVSDGRKFLNVASRCKKPVIVLKGGLSEEGSLAAASHTGSLAGSAKVYEGVFSQAGVLFAQNMSHAFELLTVFDSVVPKPLGRRTLIITDGGGFGITGADALSENCVPLAKLSDSSVSLLRKSFPPHGNIRNPLDVLGDVDTKRYLDALDIGLRDSNVDAVMLIVLPQVPLLDIDDFCSSVVKKLKTSSKPVVVVSTGAVTARYIAKKLSSVPVFEFPEHAARALSGFFSYYGV